LYCIIDTKKEKKKRKRQYGNPIQSQPGLMSQPSLFILKTEVPIIGDSVVSFLLEYNNKDGEKNFKRSGVPWQA
jgi:hypothetical protein